jgi:5-carboxymethyl-2-hydroxymuconate isomerase
MPHLIFEYTDNLGPDADIAGLCQKANATIRNQGGVFPVGGVRVRAIKLSDYCIADGKTPSDAFVHATFKIGGGRTPEQKQRVGDELFTVMREHFAQQFAAHGLALSLEIAEFSEAGTWKHNNLHARFRK